MVKTMEPMTTGSIWKRIAFFALPILLGNFFQQMYNTVDSLIVGNYLGLNALAAVSSSGNLINMLIGFLMGVSTGAGVVMAGFFGARDEKNLRCAVHTTVAFGLVAGAVMTVVGMVLSPQILQWMDTPQAVMEQSVVYLRIYFLGSLGNVLYNICVGVLQAVGDSRHPLYYLIVSSLVNLVLDLVFIAGLDCGVGGAAAATVISQIVSAVLCLLQLARSREAYGLRWREVRFHKGMLGQVLRLGVPSGVQNSIINFANVIVQSNVNAFGEMAMAGYGAYTKVEGFAFLPITSFAMALTTFIGQNLGAKEFERAKKGARFGILSTVILAELIGVVIFLLAPHLIAAFDSTPEVIAFGTDKSRTAALFYFLLAYSHASAAVLRGAGKAMVPMVVLMICWCAIRVTFLSIAVPLTGSILTVYWVYPLTWFLSSVTFFFYSRKGDALNRKVFGADAA